MGRHRHRRRDGAPEETPAAAPPPAAAAAATVALHPASGARFTPLEAQVIAIARRDPLGSLEAPGRIERLAATLFGWRPTRRPLADRRLETLRRAVVVTGHRRHMPDAVAAELLAIGYSRAQVRAVEALAMAG